METISEGRNRVVMGAADRDCSNINSYELGAVLKRDRISEPADHAEADILLTFTNRAWTVQIVEFTNAAAAGAVISGIGEQATDDDGNLRFITAKLGPSLSKSRCRAMSPPMSQQSNMSMQPATQTHSALPFDWAHSSSISLAKTRPPMPSDL